MDGTACRSAPGGAYTPQSPHHICPGVRRGKKTKTDENSRSLTSYHAYCWHANKACLQSPEKQSWKTLTVTKLEASHTTSFPYSWASLHAPEETNAALGVLWGCSVCGQFFLWPKTTLLSLSSFFSLGNELHRFSKTPLSIEFSQGPKQKIFTHRRWWNCQSASFSRCHSTPRSRHTPGTDHWDRMIRQ